MRNSDIFTVFSRKLAMHTFIYKKKSVKIKFFNSNNISAYVINSEKFTLLTKRVLKALRIGSNSFASLDSKQMQYRWQLFCHCSNYLWVWWLCRQHLLTRWVLTKYRPSRRSLSRSTMEWIKRKRHLIKIFQTVKLKVWKRFNCLTGVSKALDTNIFSWNIASKVSPDLISNINPRRTLNLIVLTIWCHAFKKYQCVHGIWLFVSSI